MPSIVYTHPRGQSSRVFLSGLGAFEHGIPRDVDADVASAILGAVVDGRFERNALFSVVDCAVEQSAQAVEPADDAAPASELPPVTGAGDPTPSRKQRKKES